MRLLFELAHWHGLAKLRMHTDITLRLLSQTTNKLSGLLKRFKTDTCSAYETHELERETSARQRRKRKQESTSEVTTGPVEQGFERSVTSSVVSTRLSGLCNN